MPSASRRQLLVAGGVIVALVAGVLLLTRGDLWPERHTDGWGPLGGHTSGIVSFGGAGPVWSLAFNLCLARGIEPAILDGTVTGTSRIGAGFEILGSVVRQGVPERGFQPIAAVEGFPPAAPYDKAKPAQGFAVTTSCRTGSDLGRAYTELDLGVRRPGQGGGGWSGFSIGYLVGWRHHVLVIEDPVVVCGDGLPADVAEDLCSQ